MVSADRGKQQMINKRSGSKGTLLPELRKVWMYPVAGGGGGGNTATDTNMGWGDAWFMMIPTVAITRLLLGSS